MSVAFNKFDDVNPKANKLFCRLLTLTLIGALVLPLSAQAADALQMKLQASKVIPQADGTVKYVPVTTASMGTTIQYKSTYTNTIDKPIENVMVTLPIPNNMTFTGSVYPGSAQATLDGKNFAEMPLMRVINGKPVKVPYSEYKAVRWNIPYLPAGKSAAVALDATVN